MKNTINNNAITSFRSIEGRIFENAEGDFDAEGYITALMENLRNDGQLILDFYHDDLDENGELAGGHLDYGVFRLSEEAEDIDNLTALYISVYRSMMKSIMSPTIKFNNLDTASPITVYMARIKKLLELEAPKIIINEEKRFLINHHIVDYKKIERICVLEDLDAFKPNPI